MFGYNFLLLDTYSKDLGNIFEICSLDYLRILLEQSSINNMDVGLAGKLNISNIPQLALYLKSVLKTTCPNL